MILRRHNIVLVLFFLSVCFAADIFKPESHRTVLRYISRDIANASISDVRIVSGNSIVFLPSNSVLNDALRQPVVQSFLDKNIILYTSPESADTILTWNAISASILYSDPFAGTLFGPKKVIRTLSLEVEISLLLKKDGKILYSSSLKRSNVDTLNLNFVDALNDPALPMTILSTPSVSFFDSIIEPAIVTIASAVAIYLFFTIRS